MTNEWVGIIDTAVKIGLGAIISGLSAYLVAKSNYRREIDKTYIIKHRELLENVSDDIEEVTHVLLKYWSYILEWIRNEESEVENSEECSKKITSFREELFNKFKGLTTSEGKLLLIGCEVQQQALRKFGELISEFYKYASRNNDLMKSSEIEIWKTRILDERRALFASLAQVYKKI